MAKLLKLRRGTTSQHSSFTGAEGEVTVDTDKETLVVHDGSTAGGHPVAAEDMANVSSSSITGRLGTGSIASAKIAADAIDGSKIADDSINSEHYVNGSIDHDHLANDCIDSTNIQDDSINSEHYINGSIDHDHLANDCIDSTNIQDDSINSEHYINGSIDHDHLSNDCIDSTNIQDDSINSEHYIADSIDSEHYAPNSVNDDALSHTGVTAASYGSATAIPAITVNAQGRITAASTNTVNTTTNLSTSYGNSSLTISSSTGNNATINEASSSTAGVMSTTHHDKLDGIATGANVGISDVVSDTSPQLGGHLDTNNHNVAFTTGEKATWAATSGSGPEIFNSGSSSRDLDIKIDNDVNYTLHQNGILYQKGANSSNGGAYSSTAASYPVRAWLNYDDEDDVTHGKGNVSSVGDNGSGQFRINWGSNFPDTNYAIVGMSGGSSGSRGDDNTVTTGNRADHTVGFVDIRTRNFNNGNMTNAEVTGFIVVR